MKKLSTEEMKFVKGGAVDPASPTVIARIIEYRTGDQFETPWNIRRQGACYAGATTTDGQVVSCHYL